MGIDITDFEKAYDATKNFQSHMPGWARHYMDERKEISKSLGLPHRGIESWRYTQASSLAKFTENRKKDNSSPLKKIKDLIPFQDDSMLGLVFVD